MKTSDLLERLTKQELTARDFGFYWERIDQLLEQILSECEEIKQAHQSGNQAHLQEEIGDLMNCAGSLAIFCGMSASDTLQKSIEKFQIRYDALVELVRKDGRQDLKNQPFEVLIDYWKRAKLKTS